MLTYLSAFKEYLRSKLISKHLFFTGQNMNFGQNIFHFNVYYVLFSKALCLFSKADSRK